jgi:hypothetical protein
MTTKFTTASLVCEIQPSANFACTTIVVLILSRGSFLRRKQKWGWVLTHFEIFLRNSEYFQHFGEKTIFSGGAVAEASHCIAEGQIQIGVIRSKHLAWKDRDSVPIFPRTLGYYAGHAQQRLARK